MSSVMRLIKTYVPPHKGKLAIVLLIAVAVAATPYAFSFLGKWLVDEALQVTGPPKTEADATASAEATPATGIEWKAKTPEEKLYLLGVFLAVILGIHTLATGLSAVSEIVKSRIVHQNVYDLRSRLHDKLARMEMRLFAREQTGQLMSRVMEDTANIPGPLNQLVIGTITQAVMLVLGAVLLFRLNVKMTFIALGVLPFYAVTCAIILPRLKRNVEEQRNRWTALNGHVVERLTNVLTIKNYAQEEREIAAFTDLIEKNLDVARRQNRLNVAFGTITTLITATGTLAVLAFGFLNIKSRAMTLGEVLAFYQVTAQLFVPISALVSMTNVKQTIQVFADRVYSVLDAEETLTVADDAVRPDEIRGDIAFDHVSLQYQEGGPFAVQDVTMEIPAGSVACLVGPTGCGKSTLIALLTRLYDPTDGEVRLDGIDLRQWRVRYLRRAIGNVLREGQVFSGTVAENIAYGRTDESEEAIVQAAKVAGLHEFIEELPDRYDTRLNRDGVELQPEQVVRLNFARALAADPAVLTVDDTYAALDDATEQTLRAAVHDALKDRTILVATSRLSICEEADVVFVMQRGRIVQSGTHAELLAQPGVYRRMYMRQMGHDD